MKRSQPLERGTPLRPGRRRGWDSTLAPGTEPKRTTKLRAKNRGRKCWQRLRDPAYKAAIRELPCHLEGDPRHECRGRVEFSHVQNEGNGGADYGNGLPLCSHAGHRYGAKSWHVMGKQSWQAYWGVDAVSAAAGYATIYEAARFVASALVGRAPVVSAPPAERR